MNSMQLPWYVAGPDVDKVILAGWFPAALDIMCHKCGSWGNSTVWTRSIGGWILCPCCGSYKHAEIMGSGHYDTPSQAGSASVGEAG